MGEKEGFNTLDFEKKLAQLKDTQESIQGLSSWCLKQRAHHKKIVSSWLNVLKRVKVEQRLVLFYLANDVIQYSKRKNYDFVESWGLNLQKATPLVRDEKVRPKILRIFKIWEQRSVYDDEFLSDLTGLLVAGAVKKTDDDFDFQPQQLVNKIKQCSVLEADTDLRLKHIHENTLDFSDTDALCESLKERCLKDDVEKELNEGIGCIERYTQALQREIVAREALLALLSSANQYYSTQRGEVKVVAYAYKSFGSRVRVLKRKLDDLTPTLPSSIPSPPLRDEDVPSPGPDEDLPLPNMGDNDVAYNIDQTFNTTMSADGSLYNLGLSSFLTSDNPLSMFGDEIDLTNANKIEVINTRPSDKQDFSINDFLKTLTPAENSASPNDSVSKSESLPGLDLLTPDSTGIPPPPTSFYSAMDPITISEDAEHQYLPEAIVSRQWTNVWAAPAPITPRVPVPNERAVFEEPPASPPPSLVAPLPLPTIVETHPTESSARDVDHRGILPPPPPPPSLPMLGGIEDVDHRMMMPSLPLTPITPPAIRQPLSQDVDHRNLISLTHQPPRPHNAVADQDYRVPPPMVPPPDIVESVDMDLSEDEEQQGGYQNQNQIEHRRNSFNNNKVLVGGEDKRADKHTNHQDSHSAPILPPLPNPFENMPPNLKFTIPPEFPDPNMQKFPNYPDKGNPFEFDNPKFQPKNFPDSPLPHMQNSPNFERPQPPYEPNFAEDEVEMFEDHDQDFGKSDWNRQRYPRNWAPRTNFRPPGQFGPQFWPRNGPRPNGPRWMGPRRFW
ncbi:uncharacterized protein LOC110995547 isoform X1 [Pieris rapae]|uniref:uncharacterized protein LOC110995547 isoform X1 n=1 Tax=Pieris rapae TaxID=64459 RepID=UPI001E27BA63|nr:uncharacterized protein LOC110995547 isoform X1 [Pieris rapae]